MNRFSRVIHLIGLLTFVMSKSAIASTTQVNVRKMLDNSAIAQKTRLELFQACDQISKPISSSINNSKNTNNTTKAKQSSQTTISQKSDSNPTLHSFWWAAEQFDPFNGRLVQKWLTYPKKQQINLTVNWQLWTLLDYLGRYRFVNQFGTVAREHGYDLNIFNQQEQCLATYKYNSISNPPRWELYLEKLGQDSLQIEPTENLKESRK